MPKSTIVKKETTMEYLHWATSQHRLYRIHERWHDLPHFSLDAIAAKGVDGAYSVCHALPWRVEIPWDDGPDRFVGPYGGHCDSQGNSATPAALDAALDRWVTERVHTHPGTRIYSAGAGRRADGLAVVILQVGPD